MTTVGAVLWIVLVLAALHWCARRDQLEARRYRPYDWERDMWWDDEEK